MLLTTFRQDGTPVPTPVWVTRVGDELRVWSAPEAGKVKRIRRNGAVRVAPCTFRGEPRGESVDATAELLPETELPALLKALAAKYGLRGWLTTLSVRYFGRRGATIKVSLPASARTGE
jgi:PPOX class probable F420-dependent enzyme